MTRSEVPAWGTRGQDADSDDTLWEFIDLAEYRSPQTPAARAARGRWAALKRLLWVGNDAGKAPTKAEADLCGLPRHRLETLVRPIDWMAGALALDRSLAQRTHAGSVSFVVGPPHGSLADLLRCWAAGHGAPEVEAPTYDEILAGGRSWLAAWPSGAESWVLPRLEHCWLRHAGGLGPVRQLLERALSGELGPGLIGCDSWAWSYLRHVAPIVTTGAVTLQAFDGRRLARLFRSLAAEGDAARLRFCDARTGSLVLSIDGEDDGAGGMELQQLAARARGNPAIARELWRARLRSEPEGGEESAKAVEGADDDPSARETVWVSGLRDNPELPPRLDEETTLVLHALLLHNGLTAQILAELLPVHRFRVQAVLLELAAAGIIARDGVERWRVTPPGYASVRTLLRGLGFLTDTL